MMLYRLFSPLNTSILSLSVNNPLPHIDSTHLFEVILPPLVAVGDVQGVQVFQGPSVISEGHLRYPLQDLVQLLLTLSLEKSKNTRHVYRPLLQHMGVLKSQDSAGKKCGKKNPVYLFENMEGVLLYHKSN